MSTENILILVVMGIYVIFMIWVGRKAAGKADGLGSYILAGRNVPWYVLGITLVATVASPVQLLGQPGFAYENGLSLYFWEKIVVATVVILLVVPIGRRIRSLQATSIVDIARARFPNSRRVHYTLTIVQIVWGIFVAALSVFGGSLLITLVTGLPLTASLTVIVGVSLIYSILGGLRAVMLTDAAQWLIIIVGVAIVLPIIYVVVGPFSGFFSGELGSTGFDPVGDALGSLSAGFTDIYTLPDANPYLLTAIAFLITSGAMPVADPTYAQRMLAARSDRDGRLGVYSFAGLYILLAIVILVLGMYGRALMPGLDTPDNVLLLMAQEYLPLIGKALFLTAVAAAAMSTISSYLNVTAGIFVQNILMEKRPNMPPSRQVLWTRIATALGGGAALLFAPIADGGLAVAALAAQIVLMAAVAPLIMAILFWRRLTERGAFWGFVVTAPATLVLIVGAGGPDAAVMGPGPLGIPVLFWGLGIAVLASGGVSMLDARASTAHASAAFSDYFDGRLPRVRPSRRAVIGVLVMWAVLMIPLAWRELFGEEGAIRSMPPLSGPFSWVTDIGLLAIALVISVASVLMIVYTIGYARRSLGRDNEKNPSENAE